MPADEPEPDDPLDALLAVARWPEVRPEAGRRAWRDAVGRTRSRRGRLVATGAAAAVVTLAVFTARHPAAIAPPVVLAVRPNPAPAAEPGRPPTPLELAMLHATGSAGRPTAGGVPLVPLVTGWRGAAVPGDRPGRERAVERPVAPTDRLRLVEESTGADPAAAAALGDLLADPATEPAAARAAVRRPAAWTDALFDALGDRRVAVRRGAARTLAGIGGPGVTDRLIGLARRGVHRPEAVAALVRMRSPRARRFVAAAVASPPLAAVTRSALAQAGGATPY